MNTSKMSPENKRIKLNSSVDDIRENSNAGSRQPVPIHFQEKGDNFSVDMLNSARKVFEIDLLREKILGYFIESEDTTRRDICSARLVKKAWLRNVNKLLFKANKPLFHLQLNKRNSLNYCKYVRVHKKKILDSFANTMQSALESNIPPISLSIDRLFFRDENHQSFSNFITSDLLTCAVVDLTLVVPKYGGSMDLLFPETLLSFPRLKKLAVHFCKRDIPRFLNESAIVDNHGSNSNFAPFIQSILNGATNLNVIHFTGKSNRNKNPIPPEIKNLVLPSSLTKIFFPFFELNSSQLQVLTNSRLPRLTDLLFTVTKSELESDTLYRILNNVKGTLRHLYLVDANYKIARTTNFLRFPVMECLETCAVDCAFVELQTQSLPMQMLLPKVNRIELTFKCAAGLRKWTDGSCFSTVTRLKLFVHNIERFTMTEMQAIHRAFPNLENFTFFGDGIEIKALKYLFREMRQLTELRIRLGDIGQENPDDWNSLLVGVPSSKLASLQETPDFLENVGLLQNETQASIKYMTALHTLELSAYNAPAPFSSEPSFISDRTYHATILQMPNLKDLNLAGAFMPSPKMKTFLDLLAN